MSEEQKARDIPELEKALAYHIKEFRNPDEDVFGSDKTLEAMCNVKARLDALKSKGGKRKSRRNKKSKGKKSKGRKSRTSRKTKRRR
jgi:hypothetical protein